MSEKRMMMNPYLQYMYSYPHKTAYGPLSGVSLWDYTGILSSPDLSLYLHLPFCQTKCGYCNLFSVTGQGEEAVERYLDAVERQLRQYAQVLDLSGAKVSDLTIGGGTPLFLGERQLERVFAMVRGNVRYRQDPQIVVETAPNQTTRGRLKVLEEAGVTRVSMGIQSFSDRELQVLWRHHSAARAREALELLRAYDLPCINLDLIYGIPGQTVGSFLHTLEEALMYEPDELFIYPLYVKHGAGLEQRVREGMVLDPGEAFTQYQEASSFLRSEGFRQDSMRRFVRRGESSVSECGSATSLALGCGGRSYLGNLHFCSPYAITQEACLAQIQRFEQTEDHTAITHGIFLSEEEEKRRYVIRHLFIYPGLDLRKYEEGAGVSVLEDLPILGEWMEEGFLKIDRSHSREFLSLTEKGLGFSDRLGPRLISPQVRARMERWEVEHGCDGYDPLQGESEKL